MKIVQVTTELTLAGAEKVILELCKGLVKKGHALSVVALKEIPDDKSQTIYQELDELGVKIYSLNLSLFSIFNIFKLKKIIRSLAPDLIHSHLIHANIFCRIFSPKRIPLVNTVHIAERRAGKWWHFFLDKMTFSKCNVQTCVSKAVAEYHSGKIGVSPEKLPVVYNGLSFPEKKTDEELRALKVEWGFEDCSKIIGSVGRLNQQKGYDWFLKLLKNFSVSDGETFGIVILGEGEERENLENIARDLGPEIKCIFPGFRKDAAQCIAAFDCFVMPSNYEGFGLTLIEAMAQGVPILAHAVDSLPELMAYYENGECLTKEHFLEGLARVLSLPKKNGVYKFSADNMVAQYLEIYKKVLAGES